MESSGRAAVKVTIVRGGGIAGIVARTELDAGRLPKAAAKTVADELARASLRYLPEPAAARKLPDAQLYEISVENAEESVRARFTDEALPENVRLLMAWVDSRPERVDSIEM